jgi:hypothetical protein
MNLVAFQGSFRATSFMINTARRGAARRAGAGRGGDVTGL